MVRLRELAEMTTSRNGLAKFMHLWRSVGPSAAVQGARARLLSPFYSWVDLRFDRVHGLDTERRVPLVDLPIPADLKKDYHDDQRYDAVPVTTFYGMMSVLPRDLTNYIFIDFGSGKGRAVFLASRYHFKKIIGVELSPELNDIALRNLERLEGVRLDDVEFLVMNASDYVVLPEQAVFYFYNPFPESVMSRVLHNIKRSYRATPRKCYFLYVNPKCAHLFEKMDFVRLMKQQRFASMEGAIYETV
jgi:SAM-dependent methyltransferase